MQRERRHNPYPWTWEPAAAALLGVLLTVWLMVHVSRAAANWLAGGGWTWPARGELLTSTFAVLGGDATAGLAATPFDHAGQGLLMTLIVLGQLAWIVAAIWALVVWWRRWGPGRIVGVATPTEARAVLGRRRLRADAAVIRPDLYGKNREQR